jgi:hypothetical protein
MSWRLNRATSANAPRGRSIALPIASSGESWRSGGEELGHHLGVGVAVEGTALGHKLVLQLLEVLDDAIVHDGHRLEYRGYDSAGVATPRPAGARPVPCR